MSTNPAVDAALANAATKAASADAPSPATQEPQPQPKVQPQPKPQPQETTKEVATATTAPETLVEFRHAVPGATFVECHSEGITTTHTFAGGFLLVDPVAQAHLYDELMRLTKIQGTCITVASSEAPKNMDLQTQSAVVLDAAVRASNVKE